MNIKNIIQGFINSYAQSGLKAIVENAVISCSAKMLYKSINRATQFALDALVNLRIRFDKEENPDKKAKKLVGLRLGAQCLKEIGEALIYGSDELIKGLE